MKCPFKDFWPEILYTICHKPPYIINQCTYSVFLSLLPDTVSLTTVDIWLKVYWFLQGSEAHIHSEFKRGVWCTMGTNWSKWMFFNIETSNLKHTVSSVMKKKITAKNAFTTKICHTYSSKPYCKLHCTQQLRSLREKYKVQ